MTDLGLSLKILQPLVGEISWSKHIVILTKCKEAQQSQFYILATKKHGWTKDVLIHKIELKTYENFLLGQSIFDTTQTKSIHNPTVVFRVAIGGLSRRDLGILF